MNAAQVLREFYARQAASVRADIRPTWRRTDAPRRPMSDRRMRAEIRETRHGDDVK